MKKFKVGVFGDSFADDKSKREFEHSYPSWVELLHTVHKHNVTSYGVSGASLYHCFSMFEKHHKDFEKIFFVVTFPGRQRIPDRIPFEPMESWRHSNLHVELMKNIVSSKINIPYIARKAMAVMIDYVKYLYDEERECRYHKLMLDEIKRIRPDVVMVDVNPDDVNPGLLAISEKERIENGMDVSVFAHGNDNRMCHFSKRNNEIFSQKVDSWLNDSPVVYTLDEFEVPSKQEIEFFFKGKK
jgi:hypothetical protein